MDQTGFLTEWADLNQPQQVVQLPYSVVELLEEVVGELELGERFILN